MGDKAFVVVFLKPEISTGYFKFSSSSDQDSDGDASPSTAPSSSIPGVSAVKAAFLLPNGRILQTVFTRIKEKGFEIVQQRMKQFTRSEARELFSYEFQRLGEDDQAFAAFLASITSGLTLALLLKLPVTSATGDSNAAIKKWNDLVGHWDPMVARKKALAESVPHDQWPLRALCGLNAVQNGISSSAHASCARRERFLLFPPATPRLERATIVMLPAFHSTFPEGKEILLSALGTGVRAIVVASTETCALPGHDIITLCGLTHTPGEGPIQQVCGDILQRSEEVVGDKGVDVLVVEGLDLSYTLRAIVGPANVEFARLYFPESVRAQLPSKLPSVELPLGLHLDETADGDALGFESGLFVSFNPRLSIGKMLQNPHEDFTGAPQKGTPLEFTLGLIKPNAACKSDVVEKILHMVTLFGFTVEKQRRLLLSREQAGAFYAEHRGKSFFETLLNFMTSGEIVALQLSRSHAIRVWRGLMGPTNSVKARETQPWTLRARFGVDGTQNATHGSDSDASAARELRFFFGSAVSPTSIANNLLDMPTIKSRVVAQRSIVPSGVTQTSIEEVLAKGLQELMGKNIPDSLVACQWLGEWLVTYRSRSPKEEPETPEASLRTSGHISNVGEMKKSLEVVVDQEIRKVVVLSLGASVTKVLRTDMLNILHERLEEARYEVVDISLIMKKHTALDVGVSNVVKELKECGRRRCVLFNCEDFTPTSVFYRTFKAQSPIDWQVSFVVHMELGKLSNSVSPPAADIPILHLTLSSTTGRNHKEPQKENILRDLFYSVFDPNVVLIVDLQRLVPVITWTQVAKRFGCYLLTFDSFVTMTKTSHNESDETRLLLHLLHSGANVPPTLLLTLLRRVILGTQPGVHNVSQKFLLLGFPWSEIQPSELEKVIGRPDNVIFVGTSKDRLKPRTSAPDFPPWMAPYWKNGLVKRVWVDSVNDLDLGTLSAALNGSLSPIVGCFVGECEDLEQFRTLQAVAKVQEFIWVDCLSSKQPTVQKLKDLLLRANSRRLKFFLYGYPRTPAQTKDFLDNMTVPQFVLHNSAVGLTGIQETLNFFNDRPTIVQLDLTRSKTADPSLGSSKLRSTFFCKQVVVVVGSVGVLDLPQLREVVGPIGYDVIGIQQDNAGQQQDEVKSYEDKEHERLLAFERRVQSVQAPRCLVVGAPESPNFYHALEARIGCAICKIVILQSVQVHVRDPNALDDGDSDDYSDEEEGPGQTDENDSDTNDNPLSTRSGVKWQKVMKALSPQLSQLLYTFSSSSTSSISVDVLGFLETTPRGSPDIVRDIAARLRPRLLGVVGHPFSFYETAARRCCGRHLVGFVNLGQASSSLQALEQLELIVASSPHAAYCIDGFPRASLPGDSEPSGSTSAPPPRYVAQQLWELSRRVGTLSTLVHFTAALEVLEERTPKRVTRRILNEAQDDLELASGDLLNWFATGKSRHGATSEVTCDQTLEDAQEELDSVLKRVLRPRRPGVKQKAI